MDLSNQMPDIMSSNILLTLPMLFALGRAVSGLNRVGTVRFTTVAARSYGLVLDIRKPPASGRGAIRLLLSLRRDRPPASTLAFVPRPLLLEQLPPAAPRRGRHYRHCDATPPARATAKTLSGTGLRTFGG